MTNNYVLSPDSVFRQDKESIPYMRTFEVKYLSATNTRGSRVKIIDLQRSEHKEVYVVISYDYELNNIWEMAQKYLNEKGIKIVCRCSSNDRDYLLTDNFTTDIKTGKTIEQDYAERHNTEVK